MFTPVNALRRRCKQLLISFNKLFKSKRSSVCHNCSKFLNTIRGGRESCSLQTPHSAAAVSVSLEVQLFHGGIIYAGTDQRGSLQQSVVIMGIFIFIAGPDLIVSGQTSLQLKSQIDPEGTSPQVRRKLCYKRLKRSLLRALFLISKLLVFFIPAKLCLFKITKTIHASVSHISAQFEATS